MELNNQCSGYNKLKERWGSSPSDSELEKQIEIRMMNLNNQCSDYDELMERWDYAPSDSELQKQIEIRMIELNNQCSNYNKLIERWDSSPSDSELEKQIKKRIMDLLSKGDRASLDLALTFAERFEKIDDTPSFCREVLRELIKKTLQQEPAKK